MAHSSNALIALPVEFSSRASSSPAAPRNPSSTPTADKALSIARTPSSSNVTVIEDIEDGEDQVLKTVLKCQHQPGSQTPQCQTCKTVNAAIKQLEWHKSTLRAFAQTHLQTAKQNLPFLFLEAIKAHAHPNLNCRDWQSFSSATASRKIVEADEPLAGNKYFRRYSLRFELWCRELGLDEERLWTDWVNNQTVKDLESTTGNEHDIEDSEAVWAVRNDTPQRWRPVLKS